MLSRQDLLSTAVRVVNQSFLGMMITVDAQGVPHGRWVGTATAAEGLSRIYTICGKHTRKVEQLQHNPNVCWVFTNPEYTDVVTLHGQGRVDPSPLARQAVWDRLVECARTYTMGALSDDANLEFVTIETTVQRVELLSPRLGMYQPQGVDIA